MAQAVYDLILQVQMLKMINRKIEPNNSQTCANCKFDHEEWFEEACDSCCDAHSNWQPKTEPQIFICPIQNDYEALIEDEPQTDCAWGKGDK